MLELVLCLVRVGKWRGPAKFGGQKSKFSNLMCTYILYFEAII